MQKTNSFCGIKNENQQTSFQKNIDWHPLDSTGDGLLHVVGFFGGGKKKIGKHKNQFQN